MSVIVKCRLLLLSVPGYLIPGKELNLANYLLRRFEQLIRDFCFSVHRLMAHVMELLTAKSKYAQSLLREERYTLGGISLEELNRLFYAQVLSSHQLTWQVRSCISQQLC